MQPYRYIIHKPDYYSFTTDAKVEYICYFTSYAMYFENHTSIASKVFAFNLELLKPSLKTSGVDKRIAYTVVTIIRKFLASKINAVVYVCDTSDNRHALRFHKFNQWFHEYDDGNIIQLKGRIYGGGIELYNAMLIHKDNKLKNQFIEAFLDLNSNDNK